MLHAGTCPSCDQGLLCCRTCCEGSRPLVVCDECDAVWSQITALDKPEFATTNGSLCPFCGKSIWQPPSRWTTRDELKRLGWDQFIAGELDDKEPSA